MNTLDSVRLVVGLVAGAALVTALVRRLPIDRSVALVVFGLLVGIALPNRAFALDPGIVLFVLLPGLVFEAAYRIDLRDLLHTFAGVSILAVPGVIVSAVVVALVLDWTTGLPPTLGLVVGAMVSATDPVAVTSTFRRLGSPRRLATLVEAESLLNDGTGLVVFAVAVAAVGSAPDLTTSAWSIGSTIVISVVAGAAAGYLASRILASLDDHLLELTISVAAAYGTYLVADAVHQSGVIATVVAGVVVGNYGRRVAMTDRTESAVDSVWEFVAFLFTALVFILIGLAVPTAELLASIPAVIWTVIAVLGARAIVVYGLLGMASEVRHAMGRGRAIPVPWLHIVFWAGLRGAVASAMALSLPPDFPQRSLLVSMTFGVVLFTLLVQASTTEWLVRRSGVGLATARRQRP